MFSERITLGRGVDRRRLEEELRQLLLSLRFDVRPPAKSGLIKAIKTSLVGTSQYVLTIELASQEVLMSTAVRPRGMFLALLPLAGCSTLCMIACGLSFGMACSCGTSAAVYGQAAVGIRLYTNHLFELIAAVVREKARSKGVCPSCGTALPEEARYCRHCGKATRGS